MSQRFWRNLVVIALAHLAALVALVRWAGARGDDAAKITWLSSADLGPTTAATSSPEPEEARPQLPVITAESPIELSTPIPKESPNQRTDAPPRKKERPTPARTEPKPKPSPTARRRTARRDAAPISKGKTEKPTATANGGRERGGDTAVSARGIGMAHAGESKWFGNMLHDRFYRAWEQPTTVVASGAKFSAVVQIRIEKDGRVSDFRIVQPSGNPVVDQSVAAAGKRVTTVDAPPASLLNGSHYDVKVNFALNGH
jgi:protein TonB